MLFYSLDLENLEKDLEKWRLNRNYVVKNKDLLRERYDGNYIAVYKRDVVDSDKNKFNLAGRISKTYPGRVVLISTIEDCVNPPNVDLPFPEY